MNSQAARFAVDTRGAILALTTQRGPAKSIRPSKVARLLRLDWQPLPGALRSVACRRAAGGRIDILRKNEVVTPAGVKGVIRLCAAQRAEGEG